MLAQLLPGGLGVLGAHRLHRRGRLIRVVAFGEHRGDQAGQAAHAFQQSVHRA